MHSTEHKNNKITQIHRRLVVNFKLGPPFHENHKEKELLRTTQRIPCNGNRLPGEEKECPGTTKTTILFCCSGNPWTIVHGSRGKRSLFLPPSQPDPRSLVYLPWARDPGRRAPTPFLPPFTPSGWMLDSLMRLVHVAPVQSGSLLGCGHAFPPSFCTIFCSIIEF